MTNRAHTVVARYKIRPLDKENMHLNGEVVVSDGHTHGYTATAHLFWGRAVGAPGQGSFSEVKKREAIGITQEEASEALLEIMLTEFGPVEFDPFEGS
ncbi:MAG: hypothetical protein ACN4GR_13675 [Arenicellales bacterium]